GCDSRKLYFFSILSMSNLTELKRKRQKGNSRVRTVASTTPGSLGNPQASRNRSSPTKTRVFAILTVVLTPILAAIVLELVLRLSGYGHPTSFFLPQQIRGQPMLVENAWFGQRFFPPGLARSPAPVVMAAKKPQGTYRIFLFGESAALG